MRSSTVHHLINCMHLHVDKGTFRLCECELVNYLRTVGGKKKFPRSIRATGAHSKKNTGCERKLNGD